MATKSKSTPADKAPESAASPENGYAVIETGGKQYRVTEGSRLKVELLSSDEGSSKDRGKNGGEKVIFDRVLALRNGSGAELQLGEPFLSGAKVTATVVRNLRGPKIDAFKKKRRKGFTKKIGHRQELTEVVVNSIAG